MVRMTISKPGGAPFALAHTTANLRNRRRSHRAPVDAAAVLLVGPGLKTQVACKIVDRSSEGARLYIDHPVPLPDEALLLDQLSGNCLVVRFVRRNAPDYGVRIVATVYPKDLGPALATLIQSILKR